MSELTQQHSRRPLKRRRLDVYMDFSQLRGSKVYIDDVFEPQERTDISRGYVLAEYFSFFFVILAS